MPGLIDRAIDWWLDRPRRRLQRKLLDTQGFVVYCAGCGEILNDDAPTEEVSDGIIAWDCPLCGTRTAFDMRHPVPIRIYPPH